MVLFIWSSCVAKQRLTMQRARMPRVRGGGRNNRGFRGRGRRGYYQPRPQYYVNSPPSGPVSLPPASNNYATPVERLSYQTPGVVPVEGTTANVETQASPPARLYAQLSPQVAPPTTQEGLNPVVPLLAEQNIPPTSAQSVSVDSTHSFTNPEQLQHQVHHGPQVEYPAPENSEEELIKVDTSESEGGGIVSVGETDGKQKDRDRSSSPTDLYLYGPQSDLSGEPESVLGKRKEPPQDGQGDGEEREGEDNGQEHKDAKKPKMAPTSPVLTPEVILEINKKVIGIVKNSEFGDVYVCILCLAQINSMVNLEKHLGASEHMRRVGCLQSPPGDNIYHFCETCYVTCLNEEVYANHIKGKKHAKNIQLSNKIKSMMILPIGDSLEGLLKKDVIKSGDGLSLGLSPHMMKFFTMEGPFIGLQYAEEVGVENDPSPSYRCTVCSTSTVGGNQALHFTSTAHRMNVLKKDYPDKYLIAKETMQSAEKKSELSTKLREICAEIESKDGRKIELIKRVIISNRFKRGPAKSTNYNAMPYGGHAVSGGASGTTSYQGRGNSSWQPQQQRGRGGRGRGFTSSPSPGYSFQGSQGGEGSSAATRRGGVNMRGGARGRGQRGRGRASQTFSSNHSNSYSNYSNFGDESQHTHSDSAGSGGGQFSGTTGHGQGAFSTGYSPGAGKGYQPNQPWSSSTGHSHMVGASRPPISPLTLNADPSHFPFQQPPGQSPPPLFGAPPIAPPMAPPNAPPMAPPNAPPITSPLHRVPHSPLQRFPLHPQSSPTSPWAPSTLPQPPQQPYGYGHDGEQSGSHSLQLYQPLQYGHQQQKPAGCGASEDYSIAGPSAGSAQSDVIKALEGTVIESEEDAERALRLSSALTQKLLAYRFKTVSSNNPIMSLLNTLQASGLKPPAP